MKRGESIKAVARVRALNVVEMLKTKSIDKKCVLRREKALKTQNLQSCIEAQAND